MIKIALADDHPLILKILGQELARELDFQILWQTSDAGQLMNLISQGTPDILVLDLAFAGQGFEPVASLQDILARFSALKILILTAYDDPVWIEELLRAGASGYVVKSDDFSLKIAEGIRTIQQGRTFLSPTAMKGLTQARQRHTLTDRERAILRLAAEGRSNPEIAQILGVADGTIRNHISNIYAKLGVDSREAAIKAAQALRELPSANANLRHELRTPLHTLLGLARFLEGKLERNGTLGVETADLLHQIVLEAERLDALLGDL